jgi:hypothetical protein
LIFRLSFRLSTEKQIAELADNNYTSCHYKDVNPRVGITAHKSFNKPNGNAKNNGKFDSKPDGGHAASEAAGPSSDSATQLKTSGKDAGNTKKANVRYNCGKTGHYAKQCRAPKQNKPGITKKPCGYSHNTSACSVESSPTESYNSSRAVTGKATVHECDKLIYS